jgi:hypothetical protein
MMDNVQERNNCHYFQFWSLLYSLGTDHVEDTASNSFSFVAHVYLLPQTRVCCPVAWQWLSRSTIRAFSCHVAIFCILSL